MKKSELKEILKEEIKRILKENMFEEGETVMYMGEPHQVLLDNGYVIKLVSKKSGTKVTLNYSQAKERIQSLKENSQKIQDLPYEQIETGDYEIEYSTENGRGTGGKEIVNISQEDIETAIANGSIENKNIMYNGKSYIVTSNDGKTIELKSPNNKIFTLPYSDKTKQKIQTPQSDWFWIGKMDDNHLFGRGDRIISVKKIN